MNATTRMHKFTSDARHVIALAQQEAERLEHDYIGTEHLLLGLLDVQDSKAARVLAQFHIDAETVRQHIRMILATRSNISPGNITLALGRLGAFTIHYRKQKESVGGGRQLTRRVRKCIHLAVLEAERQHAEHIDTDHLLSGMLREGEGLACAVLKNMGVELEALRKSIVERLT
ncbi:MAG TPA: hypothetical protein DHW02_00335 [Ktedonobacter sp.]|nr:hypothetical protein [Ktedonobacter sp.]